MANSEEIWCKSQSHDFSLVFIHSRGLFTFLSDYLTFEVSKVTKQEEKRRVLNLSNSVALSSLIKSYDFLKKTIQSITEWMTWIVSSVSSRVRVKQIKWHKSSKFKLTTTSFLVLFGKIGIGILLCRIVYRKAAINCNCFVTSTHCFYKKKA